MAQRNFAHVVVEFHLTKYRVRPSDDVGSRAIDQDSYLREQTERLHPQGDAVALAELIEEQIQKQIQ
jgi:hypothetical protein